MLGLLVAQLALPAQWWQYCSAPVPATDSACCCGTAIVDQSAFLDAFDDCQVDCCTTLAGIDAATLTSGDRFLVVTDLSRPQVATVSPTRVVRLRPPPSSPPVMHAFSSYIRLLI